MNYFEFYAGDYLRDTTRLTLVEHGAYLRLLIAYYSEECPLPADLGELYVITCAVSKADKDAVKKVAERFFPVSEEDGLRHKGRVDEEIAKAQRRIATAKANGAKGGRKSEAKKNPPGIPPGIPTGNPVGSPQETQRGTHSGEALHTPHATRQSPVGNSSAHPEDLEGREPTEDGVCEKPTAEVQGCIELRKRGMRITPQNPELIAAIAEGITVAALVAMADSYPDKPAGYVISACRRQHAESAKPSAAARGSPAGKPPIAQQFAQKTYEGTPDDQLPAHLRSDAA